MEKDINKFNIKTLLKLTIPTILMMSFMSLYTMVDGAFVSRFVGTDALSAINVVFPYINILLGLSIMIGTGGCVLVMKKLGEGKEEEARKNFSFIIVFSLILSFLVMIISILFIDKIILFLGATDKLYLYCKDYLFYMLIFVIPTILKFIFEQFLIAINKSNLALMLSVSGGILNIVLDYFFIVNLNFGIKGAAIATGLDYLIPVIIGCIVFFSKSNILYYEKPNFDFKIILKSCSNGCSEMVSQISSGIITFLFNITMLKLLGEDGVAAITIVLYIHFFATAIYLGYSIGIAPKISFYYGNQNEQILKNIIRMSLKFIWITSIFILLFSPILILFFAEKGSNVFNITLEGLKVYSLAFIFFGTNIFMSGMFTAFSNGLISAVISFMTSLVFASLGIIILSFLFDIIGLWFAVPVAQTLGFILSMFFFFKYKKIYKY